MKELSKIVCTRVISEPGDMTRYDYIILQNYDDFTIMPYLSTFTFPQRLNYYDIDHINTLEDAVNYCNDKLKGVNPNTLLEVVRTIKEIKST